MGAAITTNFTGGTSGDAALRSNWDVGLPRGASDMIVVPKTTLQAITSNLGSIPAEETFSMPIEPLLNETVTVDANVYKFVDTLVSANDVFRTGTVNTTLGNLIKAINLTGTSGVDYDSATVVHPTFYATDEVGDTMDVIARTAGTGGNGATTTTTVTGASWGAGTTAGGAATGLQVDTMFVEKGYAKDIMTSGTPASINLLSKLNYKGTGAFYWAPSGGSTTSNYVCDSPNHINAITASGVNGFLGTVEIVRGKLINNITGTTTSVYVLNSQSSYESPSAAGTLTALNMVDGTADIAAAITGCDMSGGELTKTGSTITNLNITGGVAFINDISGSAGTWLLLGGIVDARGSTTAINILKVIIDESKATLLQNKDFNTWVTRIIGD